MKNIFNTLVLALGLSFASSSVLAGGSDCWGSGADVSGDKMKQEKTRQAPLTVKRQMCSWELLVLSGRNTFLHARNAKYVGIFAWGNSACNFCIGNFGVG